MDRGIPTLLIAEERMKCAVFLLFSSCNLFALAVLLPYLLPYYIEQMPLVVAAQGKRREMQKPK